MHGIDGTVAIVTGAGSGIGRATAERLGAEGALVVVNDINRERAAETVDRIEANGGRSVTAVADVTDRSAIRSMADDIAERYGGIDILVNNAGWDRVQWFLDQDPTEWDRIIDINFRGQLNCSWAVGRHMRTAESGRIVAIASDAGRVGSSGEAVYAGTKGGIIAFTKTLARELARYDVTCNIVSPGPADTALLSDMRSESELGEAILDRVAESIPLGHIADPQDVAGAVAFFASDDAAYVTGQVLSVSGGLTMVD